MATADLRSLLPEVVPMRRTTMAQFVVFPFLIAAGCAHQRDQYAYAPPLAPPVYSQPPGYATPQVNQAVMPAPVTASAAAGAGVPIGAVPVSGIASSPGDPCAGVVPAGGTVIEAPCAPVGGGVMVDGGVVVEEGQAAPCPGELISDVPVSAVR